MARILCIEDEIALLEDIAEELSEAGHDVMKASDGAEGLRMILTARPDLVISDITMPGLSGYEIVNEVREKHPSLAEIPIIFLSALANNDDVIAGLKGGADDYLTKPIDFDMLVTRVEARLRQAERMLRKKERDAARLVRSFEAISGGATSLSDDIIWR